MTNTKFRKRALLSSVAMLLVALVAIGSATFAWFTTSPTANATGLTLKSTAGAGLEIKTATDNQRGWLKTAYLNFDKAAYTADNTVVRSRTGAFDIQPASYTGTVDEFLNVAAEKMDESDANPNAVIGEAALQNNTYAAPVSDPGVYKETIDLRVTGGNSKVISLSSVGVNLHSNAIDTKEAVRILVTETDGTVIGYYSATDNSGTDKRFNHGDKEKTYKQVDDPTASPAVDTLGTRTINNKSTAVALNGGEATSSHTINVYVFLDGFNQYVNSATVDGSTLVDSITLNFSIPS